MHCYNYLCTKFDIYTVLKTDSTTYVIDSLKIAEAHRDSVVLKQMYGIEKDTSIYFSLEKLSAQSNLDQKSVLNQGHVGVNKLFTLEQDDGVFALLLLCFLFFTRIYRGSFTFFKENSRLLFSARTSVNLFSETTVTEFWFNFILIFQAILLGAIVLFDVFLESDKYSLPQHSFYTIVLFMGVLTCFMALKYLFYRMLGYLFSIQDRVQVWLRSYLIVIEMMGIIAFIPALVLVYSQNYHDLLIIFFLSMFVISRFILFYRVITFFLQENVNFFFLIAYLCSVEIIPYIILYQVLIYLYKIDLTSLLWL